MLRSPATNFNSHAHVERDLPFLSSKAKTGYFNSHAHVERDTTPDDLQCYFKDFNSHAHVERDIFVRSYKYIIEIFQLTRSRGA